MRSFFNRFRRDKGRFAILLHARNLVITDDRDIESAGAAYTWCDVEAEDIDRAILRAIDELVTAEAFIQEVRNRNDPAIRFEAEEIVPLDSDEPNRSTGIVFYVAVVDEN